jgi:hypothetical protein
MYRPVSGIVLGVVNCDTSNSLCVSLDGSTTPAILYFAPHRRNGISFGGAKDVLHIAKWIRELTSLDPYTKPGSLLFTAPDEIESIVADNKWVFVVVDNPRKHSFNHTEIRKCEGERSVEIRAISNVQFVSEGARLCRGGQSCAVLVGAGETVVYDGEATAERILAFVDDRVPREL